MQSYLSGKIYEVLVYMCLGIKVISLVTKHLNHGSPSTPWAWSHLSSEAQDYNHGISLSCSLRLQVGNTLLPFFGVLGKIQFHECVGGSNFLLQIATVVTRLPCDPLHILAHSSRHFLQSLQSREFLSKIKLTVLCSVITSVIKYISCSCILLFKSKSQSYSWPQKSYYPQNIHKDVITNNQRSGVQFRVYPTQFHIECSYCYTSETEIQEPTYCNSGRVTSGKQNWSNI